MIQMSKIHYAYTCETGCGQTTIIDKHYKTKRVFCGVCGVKTEMVYQGECYVEMKPAINILKEKDDVDRLYGELNEKDVARIMKEARESPIIPTICVQTIDDAERIFKTGASRNPITETIKIQTLEQLKNHYTEDEIKKAIEKVEKAAAKMKKS